MKRAAIVLTIIVCALAAAQTHPAAPDTVSRAEVVLAAKQALDAASRNLGRWLTFVIIAVLVATVLAVWRIWALSRQVARLEDMRSAWETRFAGTADEVLRLKRKLADSESRAGKLETDMAALRPAEPEAATAQVAMVQSELVAVRERLDRAEASLEAVADHTVVTKQERAMVEELLKTASDERVRIEALVKSAVEERSQAEGLVKTAAEKIAKGERLVNAATEERTKVEGLVDAAARERAKVEGLVGSVARERARAEGLAAAAAKAQAEAEAAAARADGIARRAAAIDLLHGADEKLVQQQYPAAVQAYTLCLQSLEGGPSDEPKLRFHALHSRAIANLRQREFGAVLTDAGAIGRLATQEARGASHLLAGVARLWQGDVTQALKDLAVAADKDPGARAIIPDDPDIAAWINVNPRKAGPLKQYIRELGREPKQRRH
jgi:septal ring factor EnvC (AmiA/AmiB activator)